MKCRIATGALLMLLAWPNAWANICRVTPAPAGAAVNDGGTWANATTLVDALANGNGKNCTEIWVAAGVYVPGSAVTDSFAINRPVLLYGGFNGTESSREQRNPDANLTVLSGDIGGDDCNGSGCPGGIDADASRIVGINSTHVLVIGGLSNSGGNGTYTSTNTVIDGFVVTAGDAAGTGLPGIFAGGLYCNGKSMRCSPTLANLVFSGNHSSQFGGAIFNDGSAGVVTIAGESNPALTNVTFSGNRAERFGGAMVNYGYQGTSSPILTDVTFNGNSAGAGGAMYDSASNSGISSPTLVNVTFAGNSVTPDNIEAANGGAMYNYDYGGISSPALRNVTFSSNSAASNGGAIYNYNDGGYGIISPKLTNVILWGDTASTAPEIYNSNANPTINHSIVQGSGGSGNWNSNLGANGGGNLDADPLLGTLRNNGGFTQTLALLWTNAGKSAAIDTGNDSTCPPADQRGVPRPQIDHCDIGAYEYVDDIIFADGFELPSP